MFVLQMMAANQSIWRPGASSEAGAEEYFPRTEDSHFSSTSHSCDSHVTFLQYTVQNLRAAEAIVGRLINVEHYSPVKAPRAVYFSFFNRINW